MSRPRPKAAKEPALRRGFLDNMVSGGSRSASRQPVVKRSSRPLDELAHLAAAPNLNQPDHIAQISRNLHKHSSSRTAEQGSGGAALQRLQIVPDASKAEVAAVQMMS